MNEKAIYRINSSPPASLLNTVEPPSQEHIPIITQTDLDNGYVMRYFTRQSNHTTGEIYEISKQTFDRFRTNSLFQTLELKWKIVGALDDIIRNDIRIYTGVLSANMITLANAEAVLPGLKQKLSNLVQYYKGP